MADKILNTRLRLKYDTLANWSAANPVLLEGEVGVVSVNVGEHGSVDNKANGYVIRPAILFKVGDKDGTAFNDLPWASAMAADVHAWAKKASLEYADLPEELKNEVDALQTLTAGELKFGETTYTSLKEYVDAKTAGIATDAALGDLQNKVAALEAALTNYATTEYVNGKVSEINGAISTLTGRVSAIEADYLKAADKVELQNAINAIEEYDDTEVRGLIAEVQAKAEAAYVKPEGGIPKNDLANDVKDSLALADTALQEHQDISHLAKQSDVTALTGRVADLEAADLTINAAIDAIEADYLKTADKTELEGKITTAQNTADTAKAAIDAFLLEADATEKAVDTLKEIQAELAEGEASAASMLAEINALKAVDNATQEELDNALATVNENIGKKADQTTVNAIDGRVTNLEKIDFADKAYVDQAEADAIAIAAADALTKANTAETNAKNYANGLAGNYATAAQGQLADTAIQNITTTADNGLKVSKTGTTVNIDLDDTITFILYGGTATELV